MEQDKKLKNLQTILLSMIKEIDKLCREHNITYYLNGGNALGAIRHNGFIPWDDDFDIMMKSSDYRKFISICRKELDPNIWYIQEAWVDWPGCLSKIRLKNTYIEDVGEWEGISQDNRGIYIDIFEIVNAPSSSILKAHQYIAAKMLNAFSLLKKGYNTNSKVKKIVIFCSQILKNKAIFNRVKNSVYKYNKHHTNEVANFFGMSRFHNAFYNTEIFGLPYYHKYEDTKLPLPTDIELYLTQSFGNYMELPPIEKQKPAHAINIEFDSAFLLAQH